MATSFDNKASARKALRTVLTTYGTIAGLGLIHDVVSEKVAGSRGRSTLEEVPYHTVRRCIESLRKEVQTDADKAFEAPRVSGDDKRAVRAVLSTHGTSGVLNMLTQLFPNAAALAKATELHNAATERLADRRSKFPPSAKAQSLKLVTLVPVSGDE